LTLFFAVLTAISCSRKPLLDDKSAVFSKYTELETTLSKVPHHPDPKFLKLFDQFTTEQNWNFDLSDIPDGIYEAYSIPDRYEYVHYINFEIKDKKFTAVYYNEYMNTDIKSKFLYGGEKGKRNDANYTKQMKQYGSNSNLGEAYSVMEKQLLENQDPDKIDGISGASLALYRFRIMIMKSLYEYRSKTVVNQNLYSFGKKVKASITK
jgi:major membrane immunogen (membrane-anchored lipoprotein)